MPARRQFSRKTISSARPESTLWQRSGSAVLPQAYSNGVRLSLPGEEVSKVEAYLEAEWGITFPAHAVLSEISMTGVPKNIARGFRQIEEFRSNWYEAGLSIALKIDFEFYELIAEETLLGRVHSTRRTLILDEICAALAVARALPPGSRILEVGAHAGYLGMALARETGHALIAEDISPGAVSLAQRKGAGIETFAARVRDYRQWEGPAENFDLVIACYAANKMAAASLKAYCAKQLRPGGFLLLVGEGFEPVFQDPAGFTLLDIDLVGGLDSSGEFPQWIFDPLLLLQKVDSGLFPEDHDYAASCYVHGFRYYASTPETPNGKKTQAWYNATACTPEAH